MARVHWCYFPAVLILGVFACIVCGQQDDNENVLHESKAIFRSQKIDLLWQKALKLDIGPEKEQKLFIALGKLDDDYIRVKHNKAYLDQVSKDPQHVAHTPQTFLSEKLDELLTSMKLAHLLEAFKPKQPETKANLKHEKDSYFRVTSDLKEKKLQKLWLSALENDEITADELEALKLELFDYQNRMTQLSDLDQSIASSDDNEINLSHHDKNLKLKANQQKQELESQYENLSKKVISSPGSTDDPDQIFEHKRANDIWRLALKQGAFSQKELEALKEELEHFNRRLEKLEHLKRLTLADKYETQKKRGAEVKKKDITSGDFEQKLKHSAYQVDKLENYLHSKIKHTEL